ncbi:MAG: PH domain-containing protein [Pirellula sp.]
MKDSGLVHDACKWCYSGVWGILTEYFKLPDGPPKLPSLQNEKVEYLRPSIAYLNYRKFGFWIGLVIIDVVLFALWMVFSVWSPIGGLLTAPIWLFVIIVPDIIAYIAIHLKYDTTWYVLSDRSMRIRRGIWSIYETTITFENIQNVHIRQGPIQRWFGFANLMVMTAGGGGTAHEGASTGSHLGLMEGIDNAADLRQRILAKSQLTSGLGDEHATHLLNLASTADRSQSVGFNAEQIQLLKEIEAYTSQLASL